jgi:hypothetical protein
VTAEHDDPLADAVALVECATGDPLGFGAIIRNADHPKVTVILAKLLAELVSDNARGIYICADCWRAWAAEAIQRS